MERLTATSERINENLAELEEYAKQYKFLTGKYSTNPPDPQEERMFLKNIQEIGNKFKNLSRSTKEKIFKLADFSKQTTSSNERKIIENFINGFSKKLINVTNLFRDYTFTFKKNEENKKRFLVRTANPNVSEEQVTKLINSPDSGTKIECLFALSDSGSQLKKDEATRRQEEIKKINDLSEEIVEITKMVSDLTFEKSIVIDNYGDEIIDIEEHVIKSNVELAKTLKYKRRRKRFWRAVIIFLIIVLLIITAYYALRDDWFGLRNNK
ncbi:hypothetical protein NCER_100093 [Vairimorpha ceranae BRL01]|uniref:t-SNARE coiled-coil homology domain-containing protein n=2 Tax=Vairimorpha ceranae TaxID=40302 RepID=C4V6Q1_VAIC1|nr:t-snare complex subunit syntaxin [Vairimorpha ceranae]EEQ83097.1 hypothetical protein NCER_100093 [Vairimorpha ceranae BRL01]KAF5141684.1 hypothetical protein G9O61_00g002260 [Vairimorpha ceranae]KKO76681.1 t-snare complex subunit syntaxin [Vairimorpha ceranae]